MDNLISREKRKLIDETQLKEIVETVIRSLTYDDDPDIKKSIISKQVQGLINDINRIDVVVEKTTELVNVSRKIYIPVDTSKKEPFEIKLTMSLDELAVGMEVMPAITHGFGLVLLTDYCKDQRLKPICTFINPELRKVLKTIEVNIVTIDNDSFIEIDLLKSPTDIRLLKTYINIKNKDHQVNITEPTNVSSLVKIKSSSIELSPVTGFDDIVDRDKLVRSDSIKKYEVISEEKYKLLEESSMLVDTTVYSIPEEDGINE